MNGKKILVIEDDKNIARALLVRLKSAGYEPTVAYDTVSGVQSANRVRPDLILLDISMPGGGGLVAAERLSNLAATCTTPIIFLTASKQPGLREKAMALGAADFFEKPYEAQDLLAAIGRALGGEPQSAAAGS